MRPRGYAGGLRAGRIAVAVLLGTLFARGVGFADRLPSDPSEGLKQALEETTDKISLEDRIAALRGLGEMRRGLQVLFDPPLRMPTERMGDVLKGREKLAERFQLSMRIALREGETARRLAAIHTVGNMGVSMPGPNPTTSLAGHLFTNDLIEIMKRGEPQLAEAAARALGKIAPEVTAAVPALGQLLTGPAPDQRLAAAEGLQEILQVLHASSTGGQAAPVKAGDLTRVGPVVVPVAARGLADEAASVRRKCIRTIQLASTAVIPLINREAKLADLVRDLQTQRPEKAALMQALGEQAPAFAVALKDSDPEVRWLASRVLENMSVARELFHRISGQPAAPPVGKEDRTGTEPPRPQGPALNGDEPQGLKLLALLQAQGDDPLLPAIKKALPVMIEALSDADERVRLTTCDALEALGTEAAPAHAALVRALEDRSKFVRWAAARTLGKIGPTADSPQAVAALSQLLEYMDGDVRAAAATALERLGSVARDAVPALANNVNIGAVQVQVAAIRALVGIGTDSLPALPALAKALQDADPRVRQSAAEALGRFGPAARPTVPALTKALDDSEADVRKAAGDALLMILPADGGK